MSDYNIPTITFNKEAGLELFDWPWQCIPSLGDYVNAKGNQMRVTAVIWTFDSGNSVHITLHPEAIPRPLRDDTLKGEG